MFRIAFRNVLRNGRRSLMTASATAVGAAALILAGAYFGTIGIYMDTGLVRDFGHISVFKKGYSDFGSARPMDYSIADYEAVQRTIANDPVLKPMLTVVTPIVRLYGIAGNSAVDKTKTFFALGIDPHGQDVMRRWDQHKLNTSGDFGENPFLTMPPDHGVMGKGLARILGLCKALDMGNCTGAQSPTARVSLLASAGGTPNIVNFTVDHAWSQGSREMDESYVKMQLPLAQRLLFGAGEKQVTAIVLQLKRTEDLPAAKARLARIFKDKALDLEYRDYRELMPIVQQTLGFFYVLFAFLAIVLGIIVLFTIANTMSMSVMERTNEIGTARAMGVRRAGIRRLFLLEGAILGVIGASAGIALGMGLSWLINHTGITYTPPGNASEVSLSVLTHGIEPLYFSVWIVLIAISTFASLIPATRASRMKVVDALRHV